MRSLLAVTVSSNNPIPDILEYLPNTEFVLDLEITDSIRTIIHKHTNTIVTNLAIVRLVDHLHTNGILEVSHIKWPSTLGTVTIIKKA